MPPRSPLDPGHFAHGVEILDHRKSKDVVRFATLYYDLRRSKGTTLEEAEQAIKDPLYFGNLFVREGRAGVTRVTVRTADGRPIAEFTGYSRTLGGPVIEI